MAADWTISRRARSRGDGSGGRSGDVLLRRCRGRRVENAKRRVDLDADDGQDRNHVHWRDCGGAFGSKCDLRGNRRIVHSREYFIRRRDVQVRGWREDLGAHRIGRYAAYGPNDTRGVFRSSDGGKTWQKVLFKDNKTGAIDLVFDPDNPHILFAALWEARRTPWTMISGGPGSGLYRSGDDGATWKRLEGHGLPSGVLGRIGVSVSGADGNRVYAIIEAERGWRRKLASD